MIYGRLDRTKRRDARRRDGNQDFCACTSLVALYNRSHTYYFTRPRTNVIILFVVRPKLRIFYAARRSNNENGRIRIVFPENFPGTFNYRAICYCSCVVCVAFIETNSSLTFTIFVTDDRDEAVRFVCFNDKSCSLYYFHFLNSVAVFFGMKCYRKWSRSRFMKNWDNLIQCRDRIRTKYTVPIQGEE